MVYSTRYSAVRAFHKELCARRLVPETMKGVVFPGKTIMRARVSEAVMEQRRR